MQAFAKDIIDGARGPVIAFLGGEEDAEKLRAAGINVNCADSGLSMLHLRWAAAEAALLHQTDVKLPVLALTAATELPSASERALIYAMLVRCRKVISCRDKLEDMLKYDDREGWQEYKAQYENKVLDIFKATWRDELIYPYNIVDNINKYNKQESYILKALYHHLSERTPGRINAGDAEMACQLRQMFCDISKALCLPQVVIVGDIDKASELREWAEELATDPTVQLLKL